MQIERTAFGSLNQLALAAHLQPLHPPFFSQLTNETAAIEHKNKIIAKNICLFPHIELNSPPVLKSIKLNINYEHITLKFHAY